MIVVLQVVAILHVLAQPTSYRFMKLDAGTGLSNNQVTCFLKDSRGYLWFGTISGLNRYDGHTVRAFQHDIHDSTSLLNNNVIKLFEDPAHNIWVTTIDGICIYDPGQERFIRNTIDYAHRYGLPDGAVTAIQQDRRGNYWFIHDTAGLFVHRASNDKKSVHLTHLTRNTGQNAGIASLAESRNGSIWVIHKNGTIDQLNPDNYQISYRNTHLRELNKHQPLLYNLTTDADGDLWIYVLRANLGVFHFNTRQQTFTKIHREAGNTRLNSNIIQGIVEGNQGQIWIGTDHGGINLLDKKKWAITYLVHDEGNAKSLSQNTINSLYKDNEGIIWVGTYKDGVNYHHPNMFRFALYQRNQFLPKSLPYNDFNRFAEDTQGNLWLGGNGGGLIYFDRQKGSFTQYLNQPGRPNSIGSNVIVSLLIDRSQKLWIGTYYGGLSCFDGKTFKTYQHRPGDTTSLADDSVWEIFEDSRGAIWLGTLDGGLDRFDPSTQTFKHYRSGAPNSIHASYVSEITEDRRGHIWVGTSYGLEKYDYATDRFTHYLSKPGDAQTLSNNLIHSLYEDRRGGFWIGTHEGLNLFDAATGTFRSFRKTDGLPHNTIHSVVEDNAGRLWLGTPNGISRLDVSGKAEHRRFQFTNYDESDGLQGKEFNENAALRTRRGELLFGGSRGFNLFHPAEIVNNPTAPRVVLSNLYLFNRPVAIGESVDQKVILNAALNETRQITLRHSQNVLSIEFAALNFFHPEKNQYRYKLEGFDREWITSLDGSQRATYTNLDPGNYVFRVKASNNDGVWNQAGTDLKITILPPLWRTKWAISGYVLLTVLLLYLSRKAIQRRERRKFEHRQQQQEAQRMHELDQMKINFFTNVSHEFRTPLTLILAPLESRLNKAPDGPEQKQFQLMYRNAKRLLNLVNQLLDLGRLEYQEIKLDLREGDVLKFIRETTFSFSDLSEKRHVKLSFESDIRAFRMLFDEDKLEKILFNLLSNAFKFTPENGKVSVSAHVCPPTEDHPEPLLKITVEDTGIGIPAEKLEKVFDRFFQHDLPAGLINQGSGIGLSITREFVKLHGGTISVASHPDQGSCFTILLPVKQQPEIPPTVEQPQKSPEPDHLKSAARPEPAEKPSDRETILLVEDHEDFRHYLKDNLADRYRVLEAGDGRQGWQQAREHRPDLIVSDVMMPEMNGLELCRKLKDNAQTSHIPVLLLTARHSEDQKLEGYQTGAQDYIEKPFNVEILQSKIRSLLKQQQAARQAYGQQITIKGKDVLINSLDEKLIQKAIALVEKNIADPEFSVEAFSRELGMSRIHLYRKLQALTGKSPVDFIRAIRLDRSCQLLEQSQLTVSEIAYQVGFNNPKYFTRQFRECYNELPSAYASRKRQEAKSS
ncbi:two-component regulator propeller domain-containing protein [Larkinella insperata]|uniref:histidine kinase n=1 Tax=Larkinella insperata TaxID=332158 RepID=A0ABW3QD70_9BACT|nr:hybrid sensor histidine kinase/response regulator transcription factor [Larkinella insperata]